MGEVIVITSGKGGVGKTTTTANLGVGLARAQKKVLLIDTDIGLRNLDIIMGLENRILYNLVDVVEEKCDSKDAIIQHGVYPQLYLLPTAQTRDKSAVNPEQMKELVEGLKEAYDYILLDCPAGIEQGFKNAVAGADRAIVVTVPETTAIRDADRICGLLSEQGIRRPEILLNRVRLSLLESGDMVSKEDVEEILGLPIIGLVPDDEQVVVANNHGNPLVGGETPAGKAYANVCRRVMGEEVEFLELGEKKGFWARRRERRAKKAAMKKQNNA